MAGRTFAEYLEVRLLELAEQRRLQEERRRVQIAEFMDNYVDHDLPTVFVRTLGLSAELDGVILQYLGAQMPLIG